MTPTVWLLGDPPGELFQALGDALGEVGCQVTRLRGDRLRDWLRAVEAGEPVSVAPNLLVLDADLALGRDRGLLGTLGELAPWRFLPRVVVATRHDDAACNESYALGAANWVVLPTEPPDRDEACRIFAEYWGRCSLLPRVQQFSLP